MDDLRTAILGTGSGIVECLRIAQLLERHGELFLMRIYTAREAQFCSERNHATRHFASHWAGKEAVRRALDLPWREESSWRDVEVLVSAGGRASVVLHRDLKRQADARGVTAVQLSLASCASYAVAHAISLGRPPRSETGLESAG